MLDVWWVYAWIDGVNPLAVITVLVGAVAGVLALALWLWRTIVVRPSTDPGQQARNCGLLISIGALTLLALALGPWLWRRWGARFLEQRGVVFRREAT